MEDREDGKKQSMDPLEFELVKREQIATCISTFFDKIITWGSLIVISYFMFRSISKLSGQFTGADINCKLLGDVRVSQALAWLLGASGLTYGTVVKKQAIKRERDMKDRIRKGEEKKDPNRSSSKAPRGGGK